MNERWTPPPGFSYPITAGRKYNKAWESEYICLRYSVSKDAAFCAFCLLFGDRMGSRVQLASFQSIGFRDWKNAKGEKRGALPTHELTDTHKGAAMKTLAFKDIAAGKSKDICSSVSSSYEEQVKSNQTILLSIIDIIISLGQRSIPFRGQEYQGTRIPGGKMVILNFFYIGKPNLILACRSIYKLVGRMLHTKAHIFKMNSSI